MEAGAQDFVDWSQNLFIVKDNRLATDVKLRI